MRILIVPQELKGSLIAREAADAIAEGIGRVLPDAERDPLPLADGGPGTVDVLVDATAGRHHETEVRDPLGRLVPARWGELGGDHLPHTAVIEMAAASGLVLLAEAERDPRITSTLGTGDLLRGALDGGSARVVVGVGGSATNDGGAGMAQALGAHLLDTEGCELEPGGAALARLDVIDVGALDGRLRSTEVVVAVDVGNPLCGPDGASLVYGPQKGATDAVARELDGALRHYADVVRRDLDVDVAVLPGAGAAGGLGAGLVAFCGAHVRSGFDVVAEAVGLRERIAQADAVITAEGMLDRQSAFGKTTAGVARLANDAGKPVLALAGSIESEEAAGQFDAAFALTPDLAAPDEAMRRAAELLSLAAERAGRWLEESAGGN